MKIVLSSLGLMVSLATALCADPGSLSDLLGAGAPRERAVIDSFGAPGAAPMGVDWDDSSGMLYHIDELGGRVYSITPDGFATELFSVTEALGLPGDLYVGNGLCFDPGGGGTLLVSDFGGYAPLYVDMLYRFSLDGDLLRSVNVDSICDGVVGVCFDGANYWLSSYVRGEIVKCDTAFALVDALAHPGSSSGGLDFDPDTGAYYVTDIITGTVYACDETMTVLGAFGGPASELAGVAVGRTVRGRSLWCSSFGTGLVYEIDDLYTSPVEPSSWGSIKALFR